MDPLDRIFLKRCDLNMMRSQIKLESVKKFLAVAIFARQTPYSTAAKRFFELYRSAPSSAVYHGLQCSKSRTVLCLIFD